MFVLDTNTLVCFFRGQGDVARRLLSAAPSAIAIPTVVVYELETGIAKSTDAAKRRSQLDQLLRAVAVLPFGIEEAKAAAAIRARLEQEGAPIGPMDTLIAGTALAHGGILVTRNIREFGRVPGLRVEDWYGESP
jgi:tRNA(fMet)-specific endonuclease VapC